MLQAGSCSVIAEQGEGEAKCCFVNSIHFETPGTLTPLDYDVAVRELVNSLVWMGEPARLGRKCAGIAAVFILAVLLLLSRLLHKEFWKDVH
jgi:ubiquinol-cytochrome c reductase cytochrome c1 subunit